MAGPWEKYASAAPKQEDGPWAKYGKPAEAAPTPKQEGGILETAGRFARMLTPAGQVSALLSKEGREDLGNFVAGGVRGAGSIGATVLAPVDVASDALAGNGLTLDSNRQRRTDMTEGLRTLGADPESGLFQAGKLATEIGGTMGAGGATANVLGRVAPAAVRNAPAAQQLLNAVRTGGMSTGAPAATTALGRAADLGTRAAGGAISGYTTAGLIDPEFADEGAMFGGAMPVATRVAGAAGNAIGSLLRGPQVPENVMQGVQAARNAGYVVPPSQAKPTLGNRLMEGLAGKITTAQNASAKNQSVTNALAKAAIGADELTPEAIAAVRGAANQAYDDLARVGSFQADDAYRAALSKAAGSKALPGIANKEVDDLVEALSGQGALDAQQTIESIKRLRFEGSANKGVQDPVKKALGSAQMKIAAAMEDLIDRNLQASGRPELLGAYRDARTTLAKVYDVEKALTAAGNIDAKKLAAQLKKGRPLTGELRTVAEFADQFPKAAQTLEGMGSLPQASPLDWTAATGLSLATSNPLMMATVAARPMARSAVLSPAVQNRLTRPATENALARLIAEQSGPALYRAAPALAVDR